MDDAFGHWLAGFVDGEGCFFIAKVSARHGKTGDPILAWPNCRFQIALRADDGAILKEIHATLGIGRLYARRAHKNNLPNTQPSVAYIVGRIADCLRIVELFTRYPLRAKKRTQFDVWANAVHEMAKGRDRDDWRIDTYREQLAELRKYVEPEWLDRVQDLNPPALKHRRDYGTPPPCLCGCGGVTKVLSNPKGGITHPENPNYSCFMRGHYTKRILTRLELQIG